MWGFREERALKRQGAPSGASPSNGHSTLVKFRILRFCRCVNNPIPLTSQDLQTAQRYDLHVRDRAIEAKIGRALPGPKSHHVSPWALCLSLPVLPSLLQRTGIHAR